MFGRRNQLPPLTNDSYARWLRAQRPPLPMFLGLSEIEQEALAGLGDDYVSECITVLAGALRGEEAAEVPKDDAEAAAGLLDIAGGIARAALQHRTPIAPKAAGLGGTGGSAEPQFDDGGAARRQAQADALAQTFGKPAQEVAG